MVDSIGADSLNDFMLMAAFENENTRTMLLLFGFGLFATGVILFARHRQSWKDIPSDVDESRRLFEWRKLRRRSAVACMIVISGCALAALYWTIDVRTVAILSLVLFACLSGVLGLAILDLMSVTIRRYAEDDEAAREKLVKEYHRMRELADEKATDSADGSS